MVESKEAMLERETLRAREKKEQASHRAQQATREFNEKVRTALSHHKHMMGGVIVKYFPDAYCFDEEEWNILLEAALKSQEFKAKEKAIRDKFEAQKKEEDAKNREKDKVHPAGNTHTTLTRENHPPNNNSDGSGQPLIHKS